jgi:hypothetical protein
VGQRSIFRKGVDGSGWTASTERVGRPLLSEIQFNEVSSSILHHRNREARFSTHIGVF